MKAKYFKRIRKKLIDKNWCKRKYKDLLYRTKELNSFYKFECSVFFRGGILAKHNTEVYYKEMAKVKARLKYMKKYI